MGSTEYRLVRVAPQRPTANILHLAPGSGSTFNRCFRDPLGKPTEVLHQSTVGTAPEDPAQDSHGSSRSGGVNSVVDPSPVVDPTGETRRRPSAGVTGETQPDSGSSGTGLSRPSGQNLATKSLTRMEFKWQRSKDAGISEETSKILATTGVTQTEKSTENCLNNIRRVATKRGVDVDTTPLGRYGERIVWRKSFSTLYSIPH